MFVRGAGVVVLPGLLYLFEDGLLFFVEELEDNWAAESETRHYYMGIKHIFICLLLKLSKEASSKSGSRSGKSGLGNGGKLKPEEYVS